MNLNLKITLSFKEGDLTVVLSGEDAEVRKVVEALRKDGREGGVHPCSHRFGDSKEFITKKGVRFFVVVQKINLGHKLLMDRLIEHKLAQAKIECETYGLSFSSVGVRNHQPSPVRLNEETIASGVEINYLSTAWRKRIGLNASEMII